MSEPEWESRAEVLKIARLLGRAPEELEFLGSADAEQLRTLREQVTDVLFESNLGVLQRMAGASKLLPAGVLARIAERVFGPLLCARIAGLVEVSRGVDVAQQLPPSFLAEVAAELDPRRAGEIIAGIPAPLVRSVARELVRRRDWIAIGRFVGNLPEASMREGLAEIADEGLLRVAFVLDDKRELDHVVRLLDERRLRGIAEQAGASDDWIAVFDLLGHLGTRNTERLASAVGELDQRQRSRAAEKARELGVYERLGPLAQVLT